MGFEFAEHPADMTIAIRNDSRIRLIRWRRNARRRYAGAVDPETFRDVHDAWMEHLVIVFPDQHITDEEHVAFTRHFGEPEIFHQTIIRSRAVKEIFRVSNVDDDGVLMPPSHPTVQQVSLAQFWHTDSSYREMPCVGSLLHGVEISRTGGETQFINMYLVYNDLPDGLKRLVEGRRARHDFGNLHTSARPEAADRGGKSGDGQSLIGGMNMKISRRELFGITAGGLVLRAQTRSVPSFG